MMKVWSLLGALVSINAGQAEDIFTNEFESLIATRVNVFELRDPHFFNFVVPVGCVDITSFANAEINELISTDGDNDGFLDLNLVTQYATDQPAYLTTQDLASALVSVDCNTTLDCVDNNQVPDEAMFTQQQTSGICLDVVPGTTRATYTPPITTTGPCHVTNAQSIDFDLGGIDLTLLEYQQALRYTGGITTDQGLHRGFLTEETAENTVIPSTIPFIGGNNLASVLRGHATNCSSDSDMDVHPTFGDGWWMYFNSTADLVDLEG